MTRKALITGITGQDGSYLAELLLDKGYEVTGMVRRTSSDTFERIEHLRSRISLRDGDLLDEACLTTLLDDVAPDEIYNLAAQSYVATSFRQAVLTAEVTAVGVTRLLDAMRRSCPEARFYQASSSEMFGKVQTVPQNEETGFHPRSPYGVAKVYAHWIAINYREAYGLHTNSGILFNHESPRRGKQFVTRKISHAVARIHHGLQDKLVLGNVDARRDWGYAGDYVDVMWRMLQQDQPGDFVVATGQQHSVKDFCKLAFGHLGMDWEEYVVTAEQHLRPAEVETLLGDASKAERELGWTPSVSFEELVVMMVDNDVAAVARQLPANTGR